MAKIMYRIEIECAVNEVTAVKRAFKSRIRFWKPMNKVKVRLVAL